VKARQVVYLRNHTDIVFERKNLPDTYPVDRLGIGKNNANGTIVYTRVGIKGAFGQIDIVEFWFGRRHGSEDQTVLVTARPTTPFYVAKQSTTYLPSAIRKNAAQL
jgi:hypothetical protein